MTAREWMLAGLLAVAGALVAYGIFTISTPAGFIVSGLLLAGWGWLVFGDVQPPRPR